LTIKYFQFKYQNDSQSNLKPFNNLFVVEVNMGGVPHLYMVHSGDQTKVYGSDDKGVTWTQIDVDPSNTSGDNKSRDYIIQGFWNEPYSEEIWCADCSNPGSYFDAWRMDYAGGFGSESTTETGRSNIGTNMMVFDYIKSLGIVPVIILQDEITAITMDLYYTNVVPQAKLAFDTVTCTGKAGVVVREDSEAGYYILVDITADSKIQFYKAVGEPLILSVAGYSGDGDTRPSGYSFPSKEQSAIAYDGADSFYFILQKDGDSLFYLWVYNRDTEIFTEIGEADIIFQAQRNNIATGDTPNDVEKAYEVDGTKVYKLSRTKRGLTLYQDISQDPDFTEGSIIIAVTDNFLFVDNDGTIEIWEQTEILSELITFGRVDRIIQDKSKAELKGNISFAANQVIELYDDDTEVR